MLKVLFGLIVRKQSLLVFYYNLRKPCSLGLLLILSETRF